MPTLLVIAALILPILALVSLYFWAKEHNRSILKNSTLLFIVVLSVIGFITIAVVGEHGYVSHCSDGWRSLSIGSRGACSHHGGVTTSVTEFGYITGYISGLSILIEIIIFVIWSKIDEKRKIKNQSANKLIDKEEQLPANANLKTVATFNSSPEKYKDNEFDASASELTRLLGKATSIHAFLQVIVEPGADPHDYDNRSWNGWFSVWHGRYHSEMDGWIEFTVRNRSDEITHGALDEGWAINAREKRYESSIKRDLLIQLSRNDTLVKPRSKISRMDRN